MTTTELGKYLASPEISAVEAMQQIDVNAHGILYIVDADKQLLGSLTDGDIRRWIIQTGNLNGTASEMMNRNPKYIFEADSKKSLAYLQMHKISSVPVLNSEKQVTNIVFRESAIGAETSHANALCRTPVIIMAGGKGTRLYPFTKILPKPLIPIGDIPILERIINRFHDYGANDFWLTVNYKKEMIRSYFNELPRDYHITYVEESKPLGTAGSIKLIQEKFDQPVIITNCDILIEADYEKVLQYHKDSGNALTIVSSLKNTMIPYGVLHSKENGVITSMEEKPQLSCFINTGMYVLNPEYISLIPDDTFFHMTHLAEAMMERGLQVGMYPISENSFLDMGEFEEMKKMEARIQSGSVS